MNTLQDDLFSREALAGYDRDKLERGVVTLVGCGAGGSNVAHNASLSGVGEMRLIDYDTIEASNLTRSPLFRRVTVSRSTPPFKARELALGFVATSYASNPVARYAVARVEDLGLGALAGSDVVISAADSFTVRAQLADATRLLGIPLVEIGFHAPHGQVSVFSNRTKGAACWRCLHPEVSAGGVSCSTYAASVVSEGRVPATQTVASALAAIAGEAAIQALHGRFPLDGRVLHLDVRSGAASLLEVTPDPECPGCHRLLGDIRRLDVRCDEPLARVFEALGDVVQRPVVHLPSPFVVEAPCARCGASVPVGKPHALVREVPVCAKCDTAAPPGQLIAISTVEPGDRFARFKCRKLGLPTAAIFEVEDFESRSVMAVQLAGSADDIFVAKRRRGGNGMTAARMEGTEPVEKIANQE